jgi:hypothetical protein
MKIIYKYPIQMTNHQFVETYEDYFILSVRIQNGEPFIWVLVDTDKPRTRLELGVYETGNQIVTDVYTLTFIDTIFTNQGQCVWHVFEITE